MRVGGVTVVSTGRFLRIGEIFDEYWLQRELLPSYEVVIAELIKRGNRPDIFTFAQRVPDVGLAYNYYYDFDNYAVLSLSIYDEWLHRKIPRTTRQNIRASAKRGIVVRVSAYHDDYVGGIMSIYNETPVRAGKRFWHFGKNFETVKVENGTYAERSTFLAAFRGQEMVGFLKIVWDVHTAAIMQILSKTSARRCKPNNALLAEAVRQCCLRNVGYLLYGKFDYGQKLGDSLTKFKRNHGFIRMDVPRYHVPLTRRGSLALRLGLHKNLAERVPDPIAAPLRSFWAKLYNRLAREA